MHNTKKIIVIDKLHTLGNRHNFVMFVGEKSRICHIKKADEILAVNAS